MMVCPPPPPPPRVDPRLTCLVQAIIFLAPLVFNQVLDEDKRVNRLVRLRAPRLPFAHPVP